MKEPVIKYSTCYGKTYELHFELNRYSTNGALAVLSYIIEDEYEEPFASITVNLGGVVEFNRAYLDTHNLPGIDKILIKAGYAKATGNCYHSGFCIYPEVEFSYKFLEAINPSVYKEYCYDFAL